MTVGAALYDWLLVGHILAGMVWVGGVVVFASLAARVSRDDDPDAIARFVGDLRAIGLVTLAPAPVALLAFGVAMVADSDGWEFGQGWLQIGLALFAAALLIGVVHQSRAGIAMERAVTRGAHDEAARLLGRWLWGTFAIVLLLIAATLDMVIKPGL